MREQLFYVLKAPGGWLILETADLDSSTAWTIAFNFLSYADPEFGKKYYKRWSASRRAARRRGWVIVRAKLVEVPHA
jgi:hypothetical protein